MQVTEKGHHVTRSTSDQPAYTRSEWVLEKGFWPPFIPATQQPQVGAATAGSAALTDASEPSAEQLTRGQMSMGEVLKACLPNGSPVSFLWLPCAGNVTARLQANQVRDASFLRDLQAPDAAAVPDSAPHVICKITAPSSRTQIPAGRGSSASAVTPTDPLDIAADHEAGLEPPRKQARTVADEVRHDDIER